MRLQAKNLTHTRRRDRQYGKTTMQQRLPRRTHLLAGSLRATRDAFLRANILEIVAIGSVPSTSSNATCNVATLATCVVREREAAANTTRSKFRRSRPSVGRHKRMKARRFGSSFGAEHLKYCGVLRIVSYPTPVGQTSKRSRQQEYPTWRIAAKCYRSTGGVFAA